MTSLRTPVGWVCQVRELLLWPVEGAGPVTVVASGVGWVHCTRGGCYWSRVGGTEGRWGLRAVRTTLGQWIPTLVEQADSRRLGAGRRRTMTTGTLRRRRSGGGGGGPVTGAPGYAVRTPDSLLRGPAPHQTSSLRPRPHLQDHQPAQGSRPSECLRSHDTHMSPT